MIEQSFAGAPDTVPVPPLVVQGIVAGVHRVARAQLLAGREHELPGLTDELLEWVLCFRCGAADAAGGSIAPARSRRRRLIRRRRARRGATTARRGDDGDE